MLYNYYTEELLGLQEVKVTNIEEKEESKHISIEIPKKPHSCPCCGEQTDTIHDYRKQKIKDISAFGKAITIVYRKRRYRCNSCGKRFYENNTFLPRYHRMTSRLVAHVIDLLRSVRSFTSAAQETGLSLSTVIRIFDHISYPKAELPEALSIDEFKGNTCGEKYQCILTDPVNKRVLDILPQRYGHYLSRYFKQYPAEKRQQVKFFVSDMWRTYADSASVWFTNATQIIDKYHWIRQAIWAFENVRKEEQKKLGADLRKYFKRSKRLLTKRFDKLRDEEKQQVNVMLYYSANLSNAYYFKETFLKILDCKNPETAKKSLCKWVAEAECCGLKPFEKCALTIRNWYSGIANSFDSNITNGFTEGCNNKIKVLKRNAFGYRNFSRFRNRILHIFSA